MPSASRRCRRGTRDPAAEPTRQRRTRPPTAPPCGDAAWSRCSRLHALPACRSLGVPHVAGSVSEPQTRGATGEGAGIWEPENLHLRRAPSARQDFSFSVFRRRPAVHATVRDVAGPGGPLASGPARTRSGRAGRAGGAGMAPPWARPRVPCGARVACSDWARASAHQRASSSEHARSPAGGALSHPSSRGRAGASACRAVTESSVLPPATSVQTRRSTQSACPVSKDCRLWSGYPHTPN